VCCYGGPSLHLACMHVLRHACTAACSAAQHSMTQPSPFHWCGAGGGPVGGAPPAHALGHLLHYARAGTSAPSNCQGSLPRLHCTAQVRAACAPLAWPCSLFQVLCLCASRFACGSVSCPCPMLCWRLWQICNRKEPCWTPPAVPARVSSLNLTQPTHPTPSHTHCLQSLHGSSATLLLPAHLPPILFPPFSGGFQWLLGVLPLPGLALCIPRHPAPHPSISARVCSKD
jgi:hypothetical protein